jgi:GNAT superfamily N-acetyltransferase
MTIVRLEPMTWADFDPWSQHSVRGFAAQQVAAGLGSEREATAYAADFFHTLLPEGLATPMHAFWTVHLGSGPTVGHLWLRVRPTGEEVEAFVFDVEITPGARGGGLGRATMVAAEGEARILGASVMRLNVFGHNTPARALYAALGYAVDAVTLTKRLPLALAPAITGQLALDDMSEREYGEARSVLGGVADGPLEHRLPHGPATSGHRLWTARHGATPVGRVWLHLVPRSDGVHAVIRLLEVPAGLRGRGYGRAIVTALERACQELGVLSLSVTVGGQAVPGQAVTGSVAAAQRIADTSGFSLTAQMMQKPL